MKAPNIYIHHAFLAYDHVVIFNDLNLTIRAGQWTCLLGSSGVGKSTLLRMIANLVSPNTHIRGEIICDNQSSLAQQISYMAQSDLLMPWLTVLDNALIGTQLQGKNSQEYIVRAIELFAKVGMRKDLYKYPHELSGGMRQRVSLVRTLLQDKHVVLMDEPFSALDAITRLELQSLAANLLKDKTVLLVTHDPLEAVRLSNEIYILSGRPAVLFPPMKLESPTPRDPSDPELIRYQSELFGELMHARELNV